MSTRVLSLIPLLGCLSACAFSEVTVDVPYTPTQAAPLASAGPIGLAVTDARTTNRTRISVKINGYDMGGAPIRSSRPVAEIVHDALAQEFTERGFKLGDSMRVVNVAVQTFYSSYGIGLLAGNSNGDVQLLVSVSDNGRTAFEQSYKGQSSSAVLLANGTNAAASVSMALQDAVRQMFADPAFISALASPGRGDS